MVEKNTIKELLKKGIDCLGKGDYLNPLLDAQILMSFLLGVDKIYLYTHKDELVDDEVRKEYLRLIDLRRRGFPLQYIVEVQEFMGLDFKVREGVLVPRPDTEVLVETIIDIVESGYFKDKNINIVDIGTGSGAITLSLAYYLKNSIVYSVDISEEALTVARENRELLKLKERVIFLHGNLLEPLEKTDLKGRVDILVSNPPYIPSKTIDELQVEVKDYEPRLALDGGEDGLDFYRQIIDRGVKFLSEKSIIAFEIGYDQGQSVSTLLKQTGSFMDIEVITDLSGNDRVVIGKKG